MIEDWL